MSAADWMVLIPLAVGHLALFVLALNVLHSAAVPDRLLDPLNLLLLGATLAGLAMMIAGGPWAGWPLPARGYALLCLAVALVGLPTVTLLRAFRPAVARVESTRGEALDLAATLGTGRAIGRGEHNWILRIPGNRSLQLFKAEAEVRLAGLPPALDGLTIVQVSDTHFARCYGRAFFEAVAEEAAGWDADLVAFTGDLLDDVTTLPWVGPTLGRLRGRLGQYAILGNHDHRLRPGKARRALRNAGFVDLDGRWTVVEAPGGRIAVGGTSEPWGPRLDYDAAPEADFRLLLSHSPDQFPRAARRGVDFVLAGHNHGGQVRLPGFGPILMPSRYSRHFDRGFFQAGDAIMYVSQGVGGKHPIRIGCLPEITRFTLRTDRPAPAPSSSSSSSSSAHGRPAAQNRPVADLVGDR